MLCEQCQQRVARRQMCPGDGRYHHHGMIHTVDQGLRAVCDECAVIERNRWADAFNQSLKEKGDKSDAKPL